MSSRSVLAATLALATHVLAWNINVQPAHFTQRAVSPIRMASMPTPPPPSGFSWSDDSELGFQSTAAAVDLRVVTEPKTSPIEPNTSPKPVESKAAPKKVTKASPTGLFAPLVLGAKRVMGTKELNAMRAEVILQHSKVISSFVDTSDSPFGQLALRTLFAAADKDKSGELDKEEVRAALHALGFTFLKEKQVDGIVKRADADDNEVIDFEEFVTEAPRTLRTNLVKLAKQNGHDLGFLA